MTTLSNPVIGGVEIATDTKGRFNLNALHKASGLGPNKAPAQWLRTKTAQGLVEELTDMQICTSPIEAVKGGANQGTFAHQLLAVSYAGWISPAFQLRVNQVFLNCGGVSRDSYGELLASHVAVQQCNLEFLQQQVAALETRLGSLDSLGPALSFERYAQLLEAENTLLRQSNRVI